MDLLRGSFGIVSDKCYICFKFCNNSNYNRCKTNVITNYNHLLDVENQFFFFRNVGEKRGLTLTVALTSPDGVATDDTTRVGRIEIQKKNFFFLNRSLRVT